MTVVWLFLGFLVLVALGLLVLDDTRRRGRAHSRALVNENDALRALVHEVNTEARLQLAAGDPAFGFVIQLIDESGHLAPTRKELPR